MVDDFFRTYVIINTNCKFLNSFNLTFNNKNINHCLDVIYHNIKNFFMTFKLYTFFNEKFSIE